MQHIIDFIIFPIIALISLFCKPILKKKHIWIIEENENEACDNGYVFYKYLRKNRKDINAYYVIKKKSKDYEKVSKLGNVVKHRSLKHWVYYLNAEKIIITQKYANPSWALFYFLHVKGIIKNPRIFLQHGITKDDAEFLYHDRTKFRLFICGAKNEYEYIKEKFGYPEDNLAYTGLARFDELNIENKKENNKRIKQNILITPTWRKWISNQNEFDQFIKNYYEIFEDKELRVLLNKNNIKVDIVLHKNLEKYKIDSKYINNKMINVYHNSEANIQSYINKADFYITDYSSIFFDIAYRNIPMCYYQFDEKEYRKKQLKNGYFDYKKDGFGEVAKTKKELIELLKKYIDNNFKTDKIYKERMSKFFEYRDKNNCKRILEEIEKV